MLRYSNADFRLLEKAKSFGLIKSAFYTSLHNKLELTGQIIRGLGGSLSKEEVVGLFPNSKKKKAPQVAPAKNFLKRPEISINSMPKRYFSVLEKNTMSPHWAREVLLEVETQIKYEGYIKRQKKQVLRMKRQENVLIPPRFNYRSIAGLSSEAKEKFSRIKPQTLGQAQRISGITPADVSVLSVMLVV